MSYDKKIIDVHKRILSHLSGDLSLETYVYHASLFISKLNPHQESSFIRAKQTHGTIVDRQGLEKYIFLVEKFFPACEGLLELKRACSVDVCEKCGVSFQSEDDGYVICKCGHVVEVIEYSDTFRDVDRTSATPKISDTRYTHFLEALARFDGTAPVKFPERFRETYYEWCQDHGIKNPQRVSKDVVRDFLEDKRFNRLYNHINRVYNELTGSPLPQIRHLKTGMIEKYKLAMIAFDKIEDKTRESSPLVDYIVYQLLLGYKFDVRMSDFYMLKTEQKRKEHANTWQKIVEKEPKLRKNFFVL